MKHYFNILFASCLLAVSPAAMSQAQCKVKPIVKNCMSSLAPYGYDSYAVKDIIYTKNVKKEVLEFSVYSDEEYKLVFCQTVLPQNIGLTIYDKQPSNKSRKIIYFDESGKKSQHVCNFRPEKTGSYFIEFEIPKSTAPGQQGCIVVLIGIKD